MAKEIEKRSRGGPEELDHLGPDADPLAQLAEALAQISGPANVIHGPEWTALVQPPAIPGTINARYTTAVLPLRWIGFALLWVTWDWKRGAFVGLVLLLILILITTR